MPFQSNGQRKYLWKFHPDIAKRWADEYPGQKNLPEHKNKKDEKPRFSNLKAKGYIK